MTDLSHQANQNPTQNPNQGNRRQQNNRNRPNNGANGGNANNAQRNVPTTPGGPGGPASPGGPARSPRPGGITQEQKRQIAERRPESFQISSDGTDDLIVSGGVSEDLQHLASIILRPGSFPLEDQKRMRRFVNSCLMNLSNHHNVDTSGLLLGLASSTGIARMKDIMLHPMSVDAGTAKSPISFQYVVLPFVGLLTREKVCQTTMVEQSNTIYTTVYIHAEKFILNGVLRCTDELLARRSLNDVRISPDRMRIEDPDVCIVTSFPHALLAITRLLFQLLTRVRQARFEFGDIVAKLQLQAEQCGNLPPDVAGTAFERAVLAHEIDRVRAIIMDAMGIPVCVDDRAAANRPSTRRRLHEAGPNIEYLERIYDPPGLLSKDGPRHDNDHSEIADIQVIPTQGEVTSSRDPFLPANGAPNAPHFIDAGWKRQLDIHFRLFREDMLDPLKKGISAFLRLLVKTSKSKQRTLLQQGKLRKMVDENVDLNVYGDVHFHGLRFTRQQRVSVQISFAQPRSLAGQATGRRREFWERSKSRLMQGGLVCLLWRTEDTATTNTPFRMVFGVIADRDITQLSADPQQAFITIALTDPSVYLVMLNDYEHDGDDAIQHFMVESPGVFFESYRPILKALQQCTPATLPFGKYLAPTAADEAEPRHEDFVQPPLYTHAPGFNFDLSVLLRNGLACNLVAANPASRTKAIEMLLQHSILDDTQAKALVETLCREVALIRGPPGTGKTKIGVDLMQVLLHNAAKMKCGPILCICYTNHALDQFLEHLLDKGVKGIVRIGAQSKSERLTDHNMETLMRSYDKSYNTRHAIREAKTEWETVSKSLTSIDRALKTGILPWRYLGPYLMDICDSQYTQLHPAAAEQKKDDDGFKVVGAKTGDDTPYYRWVTGADIEYMEMFIEEMRNTGRLVSVSANRYDILTIEELDTEEDPNADPSQPFVEQPRVKTMTVPTTNRPLELLEENGDVWNMSLTERKRLNESWKPPIQGIMLDDMKRLLEESEKIEQKMKNAYDEVRRLILKESTVIGMTTNGAAKFQTLVASVAPRIIVCEEAGEVLESHILATLSASTQHLVLIGDHLQLRPQVATYKLSTDSPVGKNYNLDKSLFERLVTASVHPLPMSHLTTQRRMRPEIADLIRLTLYPDLIDGGAVMNYPNVSGMRKNLFFMDHSHPEDSKDQFGAQSFANSFEVEMVEALVQYLIRNGYNKPGDIAVLTPYLGQFAKLRKALQNSFMLVIDERDQDQLDEMEAKAEEDEGGEKPANRETPKSGVKEISVQKHITLRTIDNYQGEEAKIVIISLVRNARTQDGTAGRGIGFLKSPNRTNVLLSRAQHGMFILGNADLLASNENGMWPQVVNELRDNDRLGPGFPIMCQNHPNTWNVIDVPENFKIIAPHGGCNLPCTYNMDCGHVCPYQCHSDDKEHITVKCYRPCPRLHTECQHACSNRCGDPCGPCKEILGDITLSCGHIFRQVQCWQAQDPSKLTCKQEVTRNLVSCEHKLTMKCSTNVANAVCINQCGALLACGHPCKRNCHDCKTNTISLNPRRPIADITRVVRTAHGPCGQVCDRNLFCGHACEAKCHPDEDCPPCMMDCATRCVHFSCSRPCNDMCPACCEGCVWECPHLGKCELPCGVPCNRMPCNRRCDKTLDCGHRCPSVCGEKCPKTKFCVICADDQTKNMLVDLIMQQSLCDVDVDDDPILVMSCGHALTMSSMDGVMEMSEYYVESFVPENLSTIFTSCRPLPGEEVKQQSCHLCRKPIVELFRYGRRIKYAQLGTRSKKLLKQQSIAIGDAKEGLRTAQRLLETNEAQFISSISKINAEVRQDTPMESRRLRTLPPSLQYVPEEWFRRIADIYGIPKEQEAAWCKHILPVVSSYRKFRKINDKAFNSPAKQLFDAAVSHLYRAKTSGALGQFGEPAGAYDDDDDDYYNTPTSASAVIEACIRECGLPPGGFDGSPFIESLQELVNVLILVQHQVVVVLDTVGLSSGWYWLADDLIECIRLHVERLMVATEEKKYYRHLAYGRLTMMEALLKKVQLLGRSHTNTTRPHRIAVADELAARFGMEAAILEEYCPLGIKDECMARLQAVEEKMTKAINIAKSGMFYAPVTEQEKVELFRAISQEVRGSGHWYRCPNGHTYVIADCGNANQVSQCPECRATIGGSGSLVAGNVRDAEFEGMIGRININQ